jgi:glycosyltransferase involved in cell wall biosynthesis
MFGRARSVATPASQAFPEACQCCAASSEARILHRHDCRSVKTGGLAATLKSKARRAPAQTQVPSGRISSPRHASGTSASRRGLYRPRSQSSFLSGAIALLAPIAWPEPFGLVLIEAMACGTPVIAFNRGSVPKIVEDGLTGFVVTRRRPLPTDRLSRLSRSDFPRLAVSCAAPSGQCSFGDTPS